MTVRGLEEAIRAAAGGIAELTRRTDVSRPSVSDPSQGAADRALAAEVAYSEQLDEIDAARAQEYALLSVLLARAPDPPLLARLARIRGDATPLGSAHAALGEAAEAADAERIEREFFDLFIGVGRGELLPYGSYYLTGFLHERPLARLRDELRALGIERVEQQHEPEDHAAILCEIMARLIGGELSAPAEAQRRIFDRHIAPWMGRFFADLQAATAADFYRHVGAIGRLFIEIEAEAYALSG